MNDDYQRIARMYDLFLSTALKHLRQDIRTYIFHKKYQRVVDVCCGTGQQLRELSRTGMHLCGIDSSLAMLEQARKVCSDEVDLHLLDAEQDSFAADSFDCAILSLALHEKHPSSARTIYSNCYRLLREQGALIIADFNPPASGILGSFLGRCLIPLIEKCAGADHYRNYTQWVDNGGLEKFLARLNVTAEIISQPLHGNLLCCAVIKNDYSKISQQNFALLDLNLRQNIQSQPNRLP